MQLFFKQDSSLPLVFADVNFEGGSLSVPEEMSSSLGMLNSLLAETGTYNPNSKRRLDKQEIEKLEESLGMSFHQGTGIDTGHIHLASLSKNTERALALANEQLCYPAILATENPEIVKIVEEEFARQKKQSIDMMRMIHNVLNGIEAAETFAKAIYPKGHKHYQKTLEEAIKDIENIKLDDVRRLYQQLFHAQNAQITVVGDINKQDIDSKLVPMLDSWNEAQHGSQRKADYSRIAEVPAPKASLKLITSKDNKPETTVIIGNPMGIQQDDADYLPAMLANQILGSGFNSRLFAKVREERGLVYSIGSMIMPMRNGSGPFTINLGCDPKNTKHAISETVATVNKFLEEGITEQELDLAKSSAKKGFAMHQFNSRASTCSALSGLQLRDKDENYVNNFDKEIDSITKEQVMAAAQKFIKPKNFTIVATKPKDFRMSEASLTQEQNSQTQAKQYAVAA